MDDVGAFVEMGDPFAVVDIFLDEEDDFLLVEVAFLEDEVTFLEVTVVLLVKVAFLEDVTVTFFVEVDALTVEVLLIVEVARLAWEEEEEAGRNI